jgi:hypothetical protein
MASHSDRLNSYYTLVAIFDDKLVPEYDTLNNILNKNVLSKKIYTGVNYKSEQESDFAMMVKDDLAKSMKVIVHDGNDEILSLYDACVKYNDDTYATHYVPERWQGKSDVDLLVKDGVYKLVTTNDRIDAPKHLASEFSRTYNVDDIIASVSAQAFAIRFRFSLGNTIVPIWFEINV